MTVFKRSHENSHFILVKFFVECRDSIFFIVRIFFAGWQNHLKRRQNLLWKIPASGV